MRKLYNYPVWAVFKKRIYRLNTSDEFPVYVSLLETKKDGEATYLIDIRVWRCELPTRCGCFLTSNMAYNLSNILTSFLSGDDFSDQQEITLDMTNSMLSEGYESNRETD